MATPSYCKLVVDCTPRKHLSLEELERRSKFMSELRSITVPPLQCSFPWNNHPDCAQLKEMSDAWILSQFGDLGPSEDDPKVGNTFADADKLLNSSFHLLATLTYASGMPQRMTPIVKLMGWFFMFDNLLDDPKAMGGDPEAADELLASIVGVLRNDDVGRSSSRAINVMADTAREWWGEFFRDMPPGQQARFIETFTDYLDGNRHQVRFRQSRCLPDLPTYLHLRAHVGGWQPCSVVIEYALDIVLDAETVTHPLLRQLQDAAAFYVYWVNDLLSFGKEYMEGDFLNIVPVLYYSKLSDDASAQHHAPDRLQDIVADVGAMIKEKDEECVRLMQEIRECDLLMKKPGMEAYLQGVCNWLGGNLYWHLVSARYGICAGGPAAERPPNFASHYKLDLLP